MSKWKKVDERTTTKSFIAGALTGGMLGGGKTYTFQNEDTLEYKTITAQGHLADGYELSDDQLGERISRGEFDESD